MMYYKQVLHTTFKLVVVAVVSALIAYLVGVSDYIFVGALGILSVSLTKKDTVKDNIKRYIDVILGLSLSVIAFLLFGFNLYVLLAFLIIFIFTSYALKINIGLIPALVLVKHIYDSQDVSFYFMLERIGSITISVGAALLINLIYPEFFNQRMKVYVQKVDDMLKDHLYMLAIYLVKRDNGPEYVKHYDLLNQKISQIILDAETGDKDKLFDNDHRYLAYLYMRRNQLNYINNMYKSVNLIPVHHAYETNISDYIKALIRDIGLDDKATKQLALLQEMKQFFKVDKLPKTRPEFETRALLFHILEDLDQMLQVKVKFHERYPDFVVTQNKSDR